MKQGVIDVLKLRAEGKTYQEIASLLGCGIKYVGYHCKKHGLGDRRPKLRTLNYDEINKFYLEHTLSETAENFGLNELSLKRYLNRKVSKNILTEEERKRRGVEKVTKRRRKVKRMAIEYKGGQCEMCGYKRCNGALEFHHQDQSKKEFGIGGFGHCKAWDKVKKELDGCMLVCANCHREIHYSNLEDE